MNLFWLSGKSEPHATESRTLTTSHQPARHPVTGRMTCIWLVYVCSGSNLRAMFRTVSVCSVDARGMLWALGIMNCVKVSEHDVLQDTYVHLAIENAASLVRGFPTRR